MKVRSIACLTMTFVLCMTLLVRAQPAAPALPETPLGHLVGQWLQAFNSGDAQTLRTFLAGHTDLDEAAVTQALDAAHAIRERAGGFTITGVKSPSPDQLMLTMSLTNGGMARAIFRLGPHGTLILPRFLLGHAARTSPAGSQPSPHRAPPAHHMPWPQLQVALTRHLAQLAADGRFSGTVLVARDGTPVFEHAYGDQNHARGIPNRLDTRYNLGSLTKMFTAVAIAQLVQQGKLRFDETLAEALPDYPDQAVAKRITLHELLTHTSGLGDIFGPAFAARRKSLRTLADYLLLFSHLPLRFAPGSRYAYSNAGYVVLGLVIEHVSGETYYKYLRQHIYDPVGMTKSGSPSQDDEAANTAMGYTRMGFSGTLRPNANVMPWRGSSAGGSYAPASDLLRFTRALLGHKLLDAKLTDDVMTGKVDVPPGGPVPPGIKYGYGFHDEHRFGHHIVGHAGGAPGVNAELGMVLDDGYTVIVLANLDPPAANNVFDYICARL